MNVTQNSARADGRQLSVVAGYQGEGGNRITQTFDLLRNLGRVDLVTLGLAALTLALALLLPRTRLGNFGRLAAIAVPSALVALLVIVLVAAAF